jgi:hypothetical protein
MQEVLIREESLKVSLRFYAKYLKRFYCQNSLTSNLTTTKQHCMSFKTNRSTNSSRLLQLSLKQFQKKI